MWDAGQTCAEAFPAGAVIPGGVGAAVCSRARSSQEASEKQLDNLPPSDLPEGTESLD